MRFLSQKFVGRGCEAGRVFFRSLRTLDSVGEKENYCELARSVVENQLYLHGCPLLQNWPDNGPSRFTPATGSRDFFETRKLCGARVSAV